MNLVTDREHNSGLTVRFGIQKMNASLSQIFASQKHRKTAMLCLISKKEKKKKPLRKVYNI
jgi:hypothetical protein